MPAFTYVGDDARVYPDLAPALEVAPGCPDVELDVNPDADRFVEATPAPKPKDKDK